MQLEVINEVARIATLDLELRPMLQRITDALARKFGWEFIALVTVDATLHSFQCEALTSAIDTSVHIGYGRALGSGVVGQVAQSGQPLVIDDVDDFPNYVETMPGARSEICVPVKHHGRLVAVLNLESQRPAAFSGQLPLLETVADTIAGAIASAQLCGASRGRFRVALRRRGVRDSAAGDGCGARREDRGVHSRAGRAAGHRASDLAPRARDREHRLGHVRSAARRQRHGCIRRRGR
jgi:GAF domain-containing protein